MSNGMILTNTGREVLVQALAGAELKFTRGAIGDGEAPYDPEAINSLVNERLSLTIHDIKTNKNGTCECVLEIDNSTLETGLWLREFGLFANDPETGNEVLYAYCNKGEYAGYLEGFDGSNPITFKLRIVTVVDQAQNITVELDSTDLERLTDRVGQLEQAFAGITPPVVIDRIRELETRLTWNGFEVIPDYSELTPEELSDKLRHFATLLSWQTAS